MKLQEVEGVSKEVLEALEKRGVKTGEADESFLLFHDVRSRVIHIV